MSFDWSRYLKLAEGLADQTSVFSMATDQQSATISPDDEAKLRTCVSRAYYAAFCSARNVLRDHDGDTSIPHDSSHFYVREQFAMSQDPARQRVAKYLHRLRAARVKADYDDTFTLSVSSISFLLVDADEVLGELDNLT